MEGGGGVDWMAKKGKQFLFHVHSAIENTKGVPFRGISFALIPSPLWRSLELRVTLLFGEDFQILRC